MEKLPENECFYCKHILEAESLDLLLASFVIRRESGVGLERYLKACAVEEEKIGEAHPEYDGVGLIIFTFFVLPIVKIVSRYVGVYLLFIFALPYKGLIEYYEKMNFRRLSLADEYFLHRRLKPRYDRGCIFMSQRV